MDTPLDKYPDLFDMLSEAVDRFVEEVDKHQLTEMTTEEWNVKDQLCHIAFWHDYYAKNYAALALGTKPFVFPSLGGSTRNQDGVDLLKRKSKKYLIKLLTEAHESLRTSILKKYVSGMTYIEGTQYTTEKFLEIVTGHIQRHTLLVKRAKG